MKKIVLLAILAVFFINTNAQEAKFQAMSIYDFTRMLQWPEDYRQGEFYIKVLGNSEIYDEIKTFTLNKKVRGEQNIVVSEVNINNIGKCHILVISESESAKLESVLSKTDKRGTLVVTQKKGLTHKGAGISFIEDGKGRYNYNLTNISGKNIGVSTSFKQIGVEN